MPPKPVRKPKAKSPVYKPETLQREQLKKNKKSLKGGYSGANKV
jgi:hypothetical protein